ncbi:HD-GYP domain-containing protein [Bacillus marasmi]|uniref:HD-GYP domain-containing protein n=1 Tax=Bacillus marasmi TaxID=1926279 RepID=UPI0011C7844B|nr:HD-GYP domain-containing protein [Bacillus marasmi]
MADYNSPTPKLFKLLRYLLFILIIAVPLITYWNPEYSSLYIFTFVTLGISLWNYPGWYVLVASCLGLSVQIFILGNPESTTALFVNLLIYVSITFFAYTITKQFLHIQKLKNDLVTALSNSLGSRDTYTGQHSENVAKYALMIAKKLKFSKEECNAIYIGGLLHDIGKIGISETILKKPTKLTLEEFEQIKLHPELGYNMIMHISSFAELGVLEMVRYHHERFDGKGYPAGLKGEEIPLAARILCVADSFDAMTSKRTYRNALDLSYAKAEIADNRCTQFDPYITDIFLEILENEGQSILKRLPRAKFLRSFENKLN